MRNKGIQFSTSWIIVLPPPSGHVFPAKLLRGEHGKYRCAIWQFFCGSLPQFSGKTGYSSKEHPNSLPLVHLSPQSFPARKIESRWLEQSSKTKGKKIENQVKHLNQFAMHAKVFQITKQRVDKENTLDENTLTQGDGSYYDYCSEISTRTPWLRAMAVTMTTAQRFPMRQGRRWLTTLWTNCCPKACSPL